MKIRNLKTKQVQEVSAEEWEAMASNGLQSRFAVVSRDKTPTSKPAATPAEVIVLQNSQADEKKPKKAKRAKNGENAGEADQETITDNA